MVILVNCCRSTYTYMVIHIWSTYTYMVILVNSCSQFAWWLRSSCRWAWYMRVLTITHTSDYPHIHMWLPFWLITTANSRAMPSKFEQMGLIYMCINHHTHKYLQPIADKGAQNLEIVSKKFQFGTRRTRILLGVIISTTLWNGTSRKSHG